MLKKHEETKNWIGEKNWGFPGGLKEPKEDSQTYWKQFSFKWCWNHVKFWIQRAHEIGKKNQETSSIRTNIAFQENWNSRYDDYWHQEPEHKAGEGFDERSVEDWKEQRIVHQKWIKKGK